MQNSEWNTKTLNTLNSQTRLNTFIHTQHLIFNQHSKYYKIVRNSLKSKNIQYTSKMP